MPLPLIIPALWAVTKFTVVAGAVKGTALSAVRLVQNGFDHEATLKQLEEDVKASKTFGIDAVKLLPALAKLRLSDDYQEICASARAFETVLQQLPETMRTGLNKSIGLEDRVDSALKQAVYRCGVSLMAHALSEADANTPARLKALYLGLMLIGRTGHCVPQENVLTVLDALIKLHRSKDRYDDLKAVECLIDHIVHHNGYVELTPQIILDKSFAAIPEVASLYELASPKMAMVYIANALGAHITCNETGSFLTYMTTYLKKR